MALMARIYEIVALLGAGGMGEVYRTRDTRLDRTVAIKVLPEHIARDPDLRARFEREARAISALDHPHICALYDVGHENGIEFLVLQYLEGETLASRLTRGALPLCEALQFGVQIADALDAAHRHGIIHRDLKPANIMITRIGGRSGPLGVKLLDFGLAKLKPAGIINGPTRSTLLTSQGAILGTLQYMAPEQVEGRESDARTDIFAFGAVLYEMITGRRAFGAESQASVIAAILNSPASLDATMLRAVPRALNRALRKCLQREPETRWQSISDLSEALAWIQEDPAEESAVPRSRAVTRRERFAWSLAVALLGVVVVMAIVTRQQAEVTDAQPLVLSVVPPESAADLAQNTNSLALSPDGRRLALVAQQPRQIWIRALDSPDARALADTEGAFEPFWSPDGRYIAFFAYGKLKKIDIRGGRSEVLCDAGQDPGGGSWSRDEVILFSPLFEGSPLYRVSPHGGPVTAVTSLDKSRRESSHVWPRFLPDGRRFLFNVDEPDSPGVYLASLDSNVRHRLLGATGEAVPPFALYSSGHLLFMRETTLFAQRLDLDRLTVIGESTVMPDRLSRNPAGETALAASDTGVLAFWQGSGPERVSSPGSTAMARRLATSDPRGRTKRRRFRQAGFESRFNAGKRSRGAASG
jgi:serine/threonine protein kinase/Tol biopolymer transport system component